MKSSTAFRSLYHAKHHRKLQSIVRFVVRFVRHRDFFFSFAAAAASISRSLLSSWKATIT